MSRLAQSLLLIWGIVSLIMLVGLNVEMDNLGHAQHADGILVKRLATDNETIAMLRAEVARIKAEQHETELFLDKEAIDNVRLQDEVRLLKLNAELEKGRRTL